MKPNSGIQRWPLIGIILIFLSVQANSDLLELHNWLSTSPSNWPSTPDQAASPFYVFYGTPNQKGGSELALKQDFFKRIQLASGWKLSFQYSASSNSTELRSSTHSLSIPSQSRKGKSNETELTWSSRQFFTGDNPAQWDTVRFHANSSLLALNDISVGYCEVVPINSVTDESTVFAYNRSLSKNIKKIAETGIYQVEVVNASDAVSYIKLIDSETPSVDATCYKLTRNGSSSSTVPIEVYLNLEGSSQAIRLTQRSSENASTSFCLNEFIALQNLQNYQLMLLVNGPVPEVFQLQLVKFHSTEHRFAPKSSNPDPAKLTSGWYYYNPLLDYSIETSIEDAYFSFCDAIGYCYPLVKSGHTHSFDQRTFDQQMLGHSPFIRIVTFPNNALLTAQNTHFRFNSAAVQAAQLFAKQFRALNHDNAHLLPRESENPAKRKFQVFLYNHTAEIKLSYGLLDLRIHQLRVTFHLNSSEKLNIVKLAHYNGNIPSKPFVLPPGLELPITNGLTVSTDEFFSVDPTQMSFTYPALTAAIFELTGSSNSSEVAQFEIEFEVQESARREPLVYSQITDIKDSVKVVPNTRTIPAHTSSLIATDWIQFGANQTLSEANLTALITLTNPHAFTGNMTFFRLLWPANGQPQLTQITGKYLTTAQTLLQVLDDISEESTFIPDGPFRLFYFIRSTEELPVSFDIEKLEVRSVEIAESCRTGSAMAGTNCHYRATQCPVLFERLTGNNCQSTHAYKWTEVRCDIANGCNNIFDRSLPTSETYATSPSAIKYFPYGEINQNYLQVNKQGITSDDWCIEFLYGSINIPLYVAAESSFGNWKRFEPLERRDAEAKKRVCASDLLAWDLRAVKAMYIRFQTIPSSVDHTYIKFEGGPVPKLIDPNPPTTMRTNDNPLINEARKTVAVADEFLKTYQGIERKAVQAEIEAINGLLPQIGSETSGPLYIQLLHHLDALKSILRRNGVHIDN